MSWDPEHHVLWVQSVRECWGCRRGCFPDCSARRPGPGGRGGESLPHVTQCSVYRDLSLVSAASSGCVTMVHVADTTKWRRRCTGFHSLLMSLDWLICFLHPTDVHAHTCIHMPYTCTCVHLPSSFSFFLPSLILHHQLMSMVILGNNITNMSSENVFKHLFFVQCCVWGIVIHHFFHFFSSLFLLNFWTFSNMYHFFTVEDNWRYTYYLSFYLNKV